MAKTVNEAFSIYLSRLTPSVAERAKASSHRASIEVKLEDRFGLYRMYESGSWRHGTGVSGRSDVDYFISLKSPKPRLGTSVLTAVKNTMQERFPNTYIHISRPAVVLEFGGGYERVELIPAYPSLTLGGGEMRYDIPGVTTEWMESTPKAHLLYVTASNKRKGIEGGVKQLARLVKAWKYQCNVPISSFYLEMRAAQYMNGESLIFYPIDLKRLLTSLLNHSLADMNDPTGMTGRIRPCSSDANHREALSKLKTAVGRAGNALEARESGRETDAFYWWDRLFDGDFPAYY
ncbi:MAG: nucleotidyltransferase [Candidatus Saccharibacteria bacterium]|nr:nucleotidyltransferase [Candidatus Saccharibacteria bacterium]